MNEAFAEELRRGIGEFNAGHTWEAHEIWEELWAEETGERRRLLQALVQAAAGYHKAEIGVAAGARKLWSSALRILEELPAVSSGFAVEDLRSAIRAALAAAEPPTSPPKLRCPEIRG